MKRDRTRNVFTLQTKLWKGRVFEVAMNTADGALLQAPFPIRRESRATIAILKQLGNLSRRLPVMAISSSSMQSWQTKLGKLTPRSLQHNAPVPLPPNEPTTKPNSLLPADRSPVLTASKSSNAWAIPEIPESRHGPRRDFAGNSGITNRKKPRDVVVQIGGLGDLNGIGAVPDAGNWEPC